VSEQRYFREIKFTVYGNPKAQKRHRMARRAKYVAQIDDSKEDKGNLLAQVIQYKPIAPWTGPIMLNISWVIARPKSHFRTGKHADELRADAPVFCHKKPDIDNLEKLLLDALNGVFWLDDGQIAVVRKEKVYDPLPERPRTVVTVQRMTAEEAPR